MTGMVQLAPTVGCFDADVSSALLPDPWCKGRARPRGAELACILSTRGEVAK